MAHAEQPANLGPDEDEDNDISDGDEIRMHEHA